MKGKSKREVQIKWFLITIVAWSWVFLLAYPMPFIPYGIAIIILVIGGIVASNKLVQCEEKPESILKSKENKKQ